MKKLIVLMLASVLALSMSFSAWGAASGPRVYTVDPNFTDEDTADSNLNQLTIGAALEDAVYQIDDGDRSYENIIIILPSTYDLNEQDGAPIMFDGSAYSSLRSVTFTGGTLVAPSGQRHFIVDQRNFALGLRAITLEGYYGGGVFVNNGTLSADAAAFTGIDVTNLEADSLYGGDTTNGAAAYITASGTASFINCSFTNNTASVGGAVYAGAGTVSFAGTASFSGNSSQGDGGALYVASSATAEFAGTPTFSSNTATGSGGAIYSAGTVTFSDSPTFNANTAGTDGGAIASSGTLTFSTAGTFTANKARGNGGAVSITDSAVTFTGVTFGGSTASTGNSAVNGGAVSITGGAATFTSSTFATNSADQGGGAIYASVAVTVGSGNTFTGNKAVYGGAIFLPESDNASLTLSGSEGITFSGNSATSAGGAVYISRNAAFSSSVSVSFTSNSAKGGNGGALYVYSGSQLPACAMTFTNNTADRGGALYVGIQAASTVLLDSSRSYSFSGNEAVYDGGAIYTASADVQIDGLEVSVANTAGNFGGFIASGGTVTVNNSTIENQTAVFGGAIYAYNAVTITGSTFQTNRVIVDTSKKDEIGGGGALYVLGTLTVTNSTFTDNRIQTVNANQGGGAIFVSGDAQITGSTFEENKYTNNSTNEGGGGAIYARGGLTITATKFLTNHVLGPSGGGNGAGGAIYTSSAIVGIVNSLFEDNEASFKGGAVNFTGEPCSVIIKYTTFRNNSANNGGGGAIYAQGSLNLGAYDNDHSMRNAGANYFVENRAAKRGGAVLFDQSGDGNNPGTMTVSYTMFTLNSAIGENGGAIYLNADAGTIESCTFDSNQCSNTGGDSAGGAVYFDVSNTAVSTASSVVNSTFSSNQAYGGSTNYGGALYIVGDVSLNCDTFTNGNTASDRGGALYIGSGTTTITATILAGNTANIGRDVYVEGNVNSRGYNRIGVYGRSGHNTSWLSDINSTTDRENSAWSKATFFGDAAELAVNPTGTENQPPVIGYIDDEQTVYLLTIMISEDVTLPLADRATNIIPFARRYTLNISQYDQQRVDRFASGNDLSLGATYAYKNVSEGGGTTTTEYPIASITMSGIPNTLKSIGQTASLVALIRYTNGRTAYGIPEGQTKTDGLEYVTWSSSLPSVVYIDKNGNLTARAVGTAIITVRTNRETAGGVYATASRPVTVSGIYSYMNVVESFQTYFSSYIEQIAEHDIALSLVDANSSMVRASSFQRNFSDVWDSSASQVTEITAASSPTFTTYTTYNNTEGLKASKNAGVNINFQQRQDGDLFPLMYSWNFTGEEIKALTGSDLSSTATITSTVATTLFDKLRIDFQGSSVTCTVIGPDGVSVAEAIDAGALVLTKADGGRGLHVELTVYLGNIAATGVGDGPQLVKSSGANMLLIVPDGTSDGAINGTMWMAQKGSSSSTQPTPVTPTPTTPTTTSGGGGGGCESLGLGMIGAVIVFTLRRAKKLAEK